MSKAQKPMTERQLAELRGQIQLDSDRLREIATRQRALREQLSGLVSENRTVTARRDANVQKARRQGVDTDQLAHDTGLSPGRIRQIAPGEPGRPRGRQPGATPAGGGRRTEVTVSVDDVNQDQDHDQVDDADAHQLADDAPATPGWITPPAPVRLAPGEAHTPAAPPNRPAVKRPAVDGRPRLPKAAGRWTIADRVDQAEQITAGDVDAARELLTGPTVIDDAMSLLDQARAGARYDFTSFPSLPPALQRAGRKKADMIWEARPHWKNPTTPAGTTVDVLDVNGAYLAALRRVHLPIGRLVQDSDPAVYDRKRAGIYLIEPPEWPHPHVPNPLGEGRTETGPVWITTPTLRLLQRAMPGVELRILESWTSGASESLLTKFGDTLAAARAHALAVGDDVTEAYVKAMYSKFVSTIGDSSANRDIRRPEWVHGIRSQAFANLWLKGARAATLGLHVHAIVGTDELRVSGDWRSAVWNGRLAFPEGRALSEIKHKRTYVVGREEEGAGSDA